jgi:hypothetical protein
MKPKQTFAALRQWRERADLNDEVATQAGLCVYHIDCLELNLPNPDKSLIAPALAELYKLEAMLAFPTI